MTNGGFTMPTQSERSSTATELAALRVEVRELRNAGSSRHEIGIAQGLLMMHHGVAPEQAYAMLSRRSRQEDVHVRAVAQAVIAEMGFALTAPTIRPM